MFWMRNEENNLQYTLLCGGLINRGSYMSAHVLLNLLNELGKGIKCEAC